MPCRVIYRANSYDPLGRPSPSRVGECLGVFPADHVWGDLEGPPHHIALDLDCDEVEARAALMEPEGSDFRLVDGEVVSIPYGQKYVLDFEDLPDQSRSHVMQENAPVGRGRGLRWSELRRALRTADGERPIIPGLSGDENQGERPKSSRGVPWATELEAEHGKGRALGLSSRSQGGRRGDD